jgi:hypothetical protein
MVTLRMLLASVAASATLGGAVGALATAATTSQASPAAIAAAVAKVKDTSAESSLAAIAKELHAINTTLPSGEPSTPSIHHLLTLICENMTTPVSAAHISCVSGE